jgi:hypothetical protein
LKFSNLSKRTFGLPKQPKRLYSKLTFNARWAAICRGAVMKGLGSDVVLNYISRYNYGTTFVEEFDERTHLPNDRDTDNVMTVPIAKNLMQWFLKKASISCRLVDSLLMNPKGRQRR